MAGGKKTVEAGGHGKELRTNSGTQRQIRNEQREEDEDESMKKKSGAIPNPKPCPKTKHTFNPKAKLGDWTLLP